MFGRTARPAIRRQSVRDRNSIRRSSPKRARQVADQPALQDRREQADIGKNIADLAGTPAELSVAHSAKVLSIPAKARIDQEEGQDQRRQDRPPQHAENCARRLLRPGGRHAAQPAGFRAAARRRRKGQGAKARPRPRPGSRYRRSPDRFRPSNPPSAGPMMKPKPKAAPIRPMPLARSSGFVMSAI